MGHGIKRLMSGIRRCFTDRSGGSTLEYVVILLGAIVLATVLYLTLKDDGASIVQNTVAKILRGEPVPIKQQPIAVKGPLHKGSSSNKPSKPNWPKDLKGVKTSDAEFYALCTLSYYDYKGDFKFDPGKDEDEKRQYALVMKILNKGKYWKVLETYDNPKTGYHGIAFKNQKTGEIVVVHRGTDDKNDIVADATLVFERQNPQFNDAKKFTAMVKSKHGKEAKSFVHSGHSLGMAIAQHQAMEENLPAVGFSGPGEMPHKSAGKMAIDMANPNPIARGKVVLDVANDLVHGRNPFKTGDDNPNMTKEQMSKDYSNQIRNYTLSGDMVSEFGVKPQGSQYEIGYDGSITKKNDRSYLETLKDSSTYLLFTAPSTYSRHPLKGFAPYFNGSPDKNLMPR